MSDVIKGKVSEVKARETRIGMMYDLVVNGKSYGAGKYEPRVKAGQYVKFNATYNGKYANIDGKVQVIDASEAGPPPAAAPSRSYGGGYNDDKRQEIISRQAARNTAVAFLQILAEKDAIPMPASAKTPAARFDVISTLLDGLTSRFNDYALGKDNTPAADGDSDDADGDDAGGDDEDFR